MRTQLTLLIALLGWLGCFQTTLSAADADEEQKLISVLQSTAGPAEKDAACARLKFIGTSRCVPALAALLTDEQLSHSARYALEPMRSDEAGEALRGGLARTKGLIRVGVINSLGARADTRAVPALIELLGDSDAGGASAAARALGQIGGPEAVKALRTCSRSSATTLHDAAVDGLLRCANRFLASGQPSDALAIFEQLDSTGEKDWVQVAAFGGRVRASGAAGLSLVLHALSEGAGPSQIAALQLVRDLPGPEATRELANLLPNLRTTVQIALVDGLAQRGDPAVLPALVALANTALPAVQVPIIHALGELGDGSAVPPLAGFAASGSSEMKAAARQSLTDLHHGNITQTLINLLSEGNAQVQAELARALAARGDNAAVPRLLDLAQNGPDAVRKSALQALSVLVDDSQLGALVDFVLQAKNPTGRADAVEALNSAYQHITSQRGHANPTPLVLGLEKGSAESRVALLPICGGLVDPKIRAALRAALRSDDPQVRSAAVRALSETTDPECLEDLVNLAGSTQEDSVRSLAINGGVRLVTQEEAVKLAPAQRVAALKSLLTSASGPEQKRKVLAGLGEVPDVEALGIVEASLNDDGIRNEAARAAIKIAAALPATQTQACEAALKKALVAATDKGTRQAVQAALKEIQTNSDYLMNWEVAGPYQQGDKDFAALFDVVFPPERKDSPGTVWQILPAGTDPKRPWAMDLLKAIGGEQRVAYARTWVHSDREQGAVLELGSDDGVKVWLNDKQVYALNIARPLQPASDKVNVTLHAGWNPLLLKITQNNQGWAFCVRIRNADGSHLDGVWCALTPKTASAGP